VHPRRIVDPVWSAKLNGLSGNTAYGVLLAEDDRNGAAADPGEAGGNPRFAIARARHSLNGESYLGGIYTGHTAGNEFNHVAGVDGVIHPGQHHSMAFSLLGGVTRPDSSARDRSGTLATVNYKYQARSFLSLNYFERYSRDFTMDTAFYERTGFTRLQNLTGLMFYPSGKFSWIRQVQSCMWISTLRDAYSGMRDYAGNVTLQANFSRQGYTQIRREMSREAWAGRYFHPSRNSVYGQVQATKWLNLNAYFNTGSQIYYDPTAPFLGEGKSLGGGVTLQPNGKFSQSASYDYNDLRNPADGSRAYAVHVVNGRTTYQFNRYFFIRATLQYDSWEDTLLQDYLASFTFIPGTVVHLGYGSLSERRERNGEQWVKGSGDLVPVRESLFFKTSYLHRF
jgi:hypothetical protein